MEQTVKSRAVFQAGIGLAILLLASLASSPSAAQSSPDAPLLLGGPQSVKKAPALVAARIPRGALRTGTPRWDTLTEAAAGQQACSLLRPVCVRAEEQEVARRALPWLEAAYERSLLGDGWPTGSFLTTDQPLTWVLSGGSLRMRVTSLPSRGFDRGSPACEGGAATQASARSCVSQAAALRVAPATASSLSRGLGALAALEDHGWPQAQESLRRAQEAPERGILTEHGEEQALLFFSYLQHRSRSSTRDAPLFGLSLAATTTAAGSLRFDAEPDLMEVLFATVGSDRFAFARLLDDFARYRFERPGALALDPPKLAWEIKESSLPRGLALPRALEPTGSVYFHIDLDAEERASALALRAYCESPVTYAWSLSRLGKEGEILSRVFVPYRETLSKTMARVDSLEDSSAVLVTGTSLGGVDLAHPFDPDQGPHEEHGCSIAFDVIPREQ